MRYQPIICCIFTVVCVFNCSCTKFVQVDPPSSNLVSTSVYQDDQTATSALLNIYGSTFFQQESWNMAQAMGLLSDELNGSLSINTLQMQYYTNTLISTNGPGPWVNAYNYIYQANAIVEGCVASTGMSKAVVRQLEAEAKFIRGFWYFYLANIYGDVPLVTSTDYKINAVLSRSAVADVYAQVERDLEDAKANLNVNFVKADDTSSTTERVRPTRWAACSVLARLFLFEKKYDSAIANASLVIEGSSLFHLEADLNSVFLKNSNEAIWQLAVPLPATQNTYDGLNFILEAAPSVIGGNALTISDDLMNAFEGGDLRKSSWVGVFTDTEGTGLSYNFPYKYKQDYSTDVSEYTMMLRLAEQFLIRSEARASNGDFAGGASDLNIIRERAGLPDYAGPLLRDSLVNAVYRERRVELFCEWGHRWFDLIRTGQVDSIMSVVTPQKGGGDWETTDKLFPIPQSDINFDPNLSQNLGYN